MTELSAFDYPLTDDRIAQVPLAIRDSSRMLVDRGPHLDPDHLGVRGLPGLCQPGDMLIVNNTRVLPARLRASKASGGEVEVLLLERSDAGDWTALVRPSRRVTPGTVVVSGPVAIFVGEVLEDGVRRVSIERGGFDAVPKGEGSRGSYEEELALLSEVGEVPLPPYIHEPLADSERYQTIYADRPGSVAAPTAGLHLTQRVLDELRHRGVRVAEVDLQVGLGTFRPISVTDVDQHRMHSERYRVDPAVIAAARATRAQGRRVIAVGTTTLRAIEAAAATGAMEGETDIYFHGEARPRLVDGLVTNFHVPRSSLLVLVDAFIGSRWRRLYSVALDDGYRFLSFGDCCFLDGRFGRAS